MNLSPIAAQTSILQEALEEQQKYLRKRPLNLSLDEKCCNEMKKLRDLIREEEGSGLNCDELRQVHSILVASEKSFKWGLQRIISGSFGSMVADAETARDDLFRVCLSDIVNQWAQRGTEKENRAKAKARILNFLANPNQMKLDLSQLGIEDLPDVFQGEVIKRVVILNLSYNPLITLPEWMGNLIGLEALDVTSTDLTILPEWIGNLKKLRVLIAACNEGLQILPESIGSLSSLKELEVRECGLMSLPESIENWYNLEYLSLEGNYLESVPEWIANLSKLNVLSFAANELVAVPEQIGSLSKLQKLDLSANLSLESLPSTVLQLPNDCDVIIEECGFSAEFLEHLDLIIKAPGYNGPQVLFSPPEEGAWSDPEESITLEKVFENLCKLANRETIFSLTLVQDGKQRRSLEGWLTKVSEIIDHKTREEEKKQIANQVLDYLEEMVSNKGFREMFYQLIAGDTITCGDRDVFSLLHIGLAYDESKIDLRDTHSLVQFLIRGVFVTLMLTSIVRKEDLKQSSVNETEIVLGYLTLLKERLQIPINVQMLYGGCSGLTEEDLERAETHIKLNIENADGVCAFLAWHPKWQQSLETRFPEETSRLKNEKMDKIRENPSQISGIDEEYRNSLASLTSKLVDWESLLF